VSTQIPNPDPLTPREVERHNEMFSTPPEGFRTLRWHDPAVVNPFVQYVGVAELAKVRLDELVQGGRRVRIYNHRTGEFVREIS
jgi:hypothetical protein